MAFHWLRLRLLRAKRRQGAIVAQARADGEEVHSTLPGLRIQAPAHDPTREGGGKTIKQWGYHGFTMVLLWFY